MRGPTRLNSTIRAITPPTWTRSSFRRQPSFEVAFPKSLGTKISVGLPSFPVTGRDGNSAGTSGWVSKLHPHEIHRGFNHTAQYRFIFGHRRTVDDRSPRPTVQLASKSPFHLSRQPVLNALIT